MNTLVDLHKFSPNAALPLISITIPIFNEIDMLPLLYSKLSNILKPLPYRYELVFVDDGSSDGSAYWIEQRSRFDPHVNLVVLSRNFGKEAALSAGLAYCRGEAIIVMDADLQDPPELLIDMLAAWQNGADVVAMKRRSRNSDNWFKRRTAHYYYRLLAGLSNVTIPADTGDFRLLSRAALDAMLHLPERNRYMKGLFAWIGFPTTVIEYDRAPRAAGTTKWSAYKLIGLAFEGLTSFSNAPLRLSLLLGLGIATLGLLFGAWTVGKTVFFGETVQGYTTLITLLSILGGMQLCAIGLLGEYVGKIHLEVKQRPLYLVQRLVRPKSRYTPSADIEYLNTRVSHHG